ncbi:esterase/lipase family protein [Sphingomonas sp. CJ99]
MSIDTPPPALLFAAEPARAVIGLTELALSWRSLPSERVGGGAPVLLLPGLANNDASSLILKRYLNRRGYRAEGWGLGVNRGVPTVGADLGRLIGRVEALSAASGGQPVALVGTSLGGILARLVAHRRPDLVRHVVTISSPFAGPGRATNVWRVYELLAGEKIDDPQVRDRLAEAVRPLPVPSTAIWSRTDGFVQGANCVTADDPNCRAVEVRSGHLLVQSRASVLRAVAEALA